MTKMIASRRLALAAASALLLAAPTMAARAAGPQAYPIEQKGFSGSESEGLIRENIPDPAPIAGAPAAGGGAQAYPVRQRGFSGSEENGTFVPSDARQPAPAGTLSLGGDNLSFPVRGQGFVGVDHGHGIEPVAN